MKKGEIQTREACEAAIATVLMRPRYIRGLKLLLLAGSASKRRVIPRFAETRHMQVLRQQKEVLRRQEAETLKGKEREAEDSEIRK